MIEKKKCSNLIIADSQFLISKALQAILVNSEQVKVAGVAQNCAELEQILASVNEGILIADIFSIDCESISIFVELMQRFTGFRVLILTNTISKPDFVELNNAGFKNIELKSVGSDEFFQALDSCIKGKKHFSAELFDLMLDLNMNKQPLEESKSLTSSEIEIVKLISKGLTTKEIAIKKNISFHTVNTHRKNIFRKMGVSNASELIMHAIKSGWIDTIEYYI
jgi:DNA-binding NarL/FixJ family response regulator